MRIRPLLLLLLAVISLPVFAQQPIQDPRAIQILQQMQVATGWTRLTMPADATLTGAYIHPQSGQRIPVLLKIRGRRQSKLALGNGSGSVTTIVNGPGAALIAPAGARKLSGMAAAAIRPIPLAFFIPLVSGDDAPWRARYLRAEIIEDEPCQCIYIAPFYPNEDRAHEALARTLGLTMCISAGTGLPKQIGYQVVSDTNAWASLTHIRRFSDYRMQNGIAVPFRQAEYVRNGLRYTLEISTVEMNVGIPESEFNIPAEIR